MSISIEANWKNPQ